MCPESHSCRGRCTCSLPGKCHSPDCGGLWKPLELPAGLRQDGLSSSGPASRVQSGLKAGGWVPSSEQVPDSRLWGQPTRPVELSCSGTAGVMELSDHLFLAGWSPPPTPEALGRYCAGTGQKLCCSLLLSIHSCQESLCYLGLLSVCRGSCPSTSWKHSFLYCSHPSLLGSHTAEFRISPLALQT